MSAKQRIEGLTNGWYAFAVVTAIISVIRNGFGIFSLFFTGASMLFSIVVSFLIGRRLLARSSLTRSILIVLSVISGALGAFACFRLGAAFLSEWSFSVFLSLVMTVGSVMMNVRSYRVLTDATVKAFFH